LVILFVDLAQNTVGIYMKMDDLFLELGQTKQEKRKRKRKGQRQKKAKLVEQKEQNFG
jgi:hypothetical protein